MERVPMLAEGYEKLTADLQVLRQERPRIVDAVEEARAHGDLSENADTSSFLSWQRDFAARYWQASQPGSSIAQNLMSVAAVGVCAAAICAGLEVIAKRGVIA